MPAAREAILLVEGNDVNNSPETPWRYRVVIVKGLDKKLLIERPHDPDTGLQLPERIWHYMGERSVPFRGRKGLRVFRETPVSILTEPSERPVYDETDLKQPLKLHDRDFAEIHRQIRDRLGPTVDPGDS